MLPNPTLWLVTLPPNDMLPPMDVVTAPCTDLSPPPSSHGARRWWQRSTLAFGPKSPVSFFFLLSRKGQTYKCSRLTLGRKIHFLKEYMIIALSLKVTFSSLPTPCALSSFWNDRRKLQLSHNIAFSLHFCQRTCNQNASIQQFWFLLSQLRWFPRIGTWVASGEFASGRINVITKITNNKWPSKWNWNELTMNFDIVCPRTPSQGYSCFTINESTSEDTQILILVSAFQRIGLQVSQIIQWSYILLWGERKGWAKRRLVLNSTWRIWSVRTDKICVCFTKRRSTK